MSTSIFTLRKALTTTPKPSLRTIAGLTSRFHCPENLEFHGTSRRGTGVFVVPTLIVTTASLVGRVSTVYESKPATKGWERFEHGSVLHRSHIASTAVTLNGNTKPHLKTKPLAVNFSSDVAVLKLVSDEEFPAAECSAFFDPPLSKGQGLLGMSHEHETGNLVMRTSGHVRSIGRERVARVKAPWPLDDDLGWVEYGWTAAPREDELALISALGEKGLEGSATSNSGNPWMDFTGQVVGISSWEAIIADDPNRYSLGGFAVPNSAIKAVLDYAKTKGPDDPVVMDSWIDSTQIASGEDA